MIDWIKKRILLHLYISDKWIDKHNLRQMALAGTKGAPEKADQLIEELIDGGLIIRDNSNFILSIKSLDLIEPFYNDCNELMKRVNNSILRSVGHLVEVKGGVSGLFFSYTPKLHTFRFHPEEHNGELLLRVRLPNLIGESIAYKSNEIYISKEVLRKSSFLEDIVKAHMKMVDSFS